MRIEELKQGRCTNEILECEGSDPLSYMFKFKVSNTGMKDSEKSALLISFTSSIYSIQQMNIKSHEDELWQAGFEVLTENNKTIYKLDIPALAKGQSCEVTPILISLPDSVIDEDEEDSQYIIVQVKDYPATKLSKYKGLIAEPNFRLDIDNEQNEMVSSIIKALLIVGLVAVIGGSGYLLIQYLTRKPDVKFSKLRDADTSQQQEDIESPPLAIKRQRDENIRRREGGDLALGERVSRAHKKKRDGSKEGSKSKSGGRSKDKAKKKERESSSSEEKTNNKKGGSRKERSKEKNNTEQTGEKKKVRDKKD